MFTLVDLLRRVVLPGRSLAAPLAEVMTSPIVTLPASATAYEAMHVMAERGVRQLVVVESGRLQGVVNERDLFALQRVSMRQINEELHGADSVDLLRRAGDDIRRLTQNLLAQGVGAEPLTRTIASLNDALTRRTIELALVRHDLARRRLVLARARQRRARRADVRDRPGQRDRCSRRADAADAQRLRPRLLAFAREVNADLDRLGFPLCPGNVMGGNPELCLSVEEWKARFLAWIREPTPQALLNANIVFDFRPLVGDIALCEALRDWLLGYTQANAPFLRLMVQNALQIEPPLGLIRAFVVDDDPRRARARSTSRRAARGSSSTARACSRWRTASPTPAPPRDCASRASGCTSSRGTSMRRSRRSISCSSCGCGSRTSARRAATRTASIPTRCNEIDQRMLKEAFRQAKQLQDRLRMSYRL